MVINISAQYSGGLLPDIILLLTQGYYTSGGPFLPDIILLTQCYLHRGTCLNAMKRFCIYSL